MNEASRQKSMQAAAANHFESKRVDDLLTYKNETKHVETRDVIASGRDSDIRLSDAPTTTCTQLSTTGMAGHNTHVANVTISRCEFLLTIASKTGMS